MAPRIILLLLLGGGTALAQSPATLRFQGPEGVTRNYQLRQHPRVWFNDSIANRMADPSPGSNASHNSHYDDLMAQGLRTFLVNRHDQLNYRISGEPAAYAALMGWMDDTAKVPWDGSKTWLQYAKDEMLGIADAFPFYFGGCDPLGTGCGAFNTYDYGGEWGQYWAMAYTLLKAKNMLTSSDISLFADYFWNGMDGVTTGNYCEYRWERGAGTIRKSGSNYILADGYGWHSNIQVGAWIQYRVTKDSNGNTVSPTAEGSSYSEAVRVATVSGNTITLTNPSMAGTLTYDGYGNFQEGYYFIYKSFDRSKTCGMWQIFASHGAMTEPFSRQDVALLNSTLNAHPWPNDPLSPYTDTVEVNKSNWAPAGIAGDPSPTNPWPVRIFTGANANEYAEVIGRSGTTLTLRRGKFGPTYAHTTYATYQDPGKGILYTNSGRRVGWDCTKDQAGACLSNLWLTRFQGYLALSLAMADDDARAASLAAKFADFFSKNMYPIGKEYFGLWNYSGTGNYGLDRGERYGLSTFQLQNSIASPAADFLAGNHIKERAYQPIYWNVAWGSYASSPSFGNDYSSIAGNCFNRRNAQGLCWKPTIQTNLLYPGSEEGKYSWYAMKTKHKALSASIFTTATAISGDLQRLPALMMLLGDYRNWAESDSGALPTSKLWITGDKGTGRGLHSFISRTDWTSASTQLWGLYWDYLGDKIFATPATYWIGKNGRLIDLSDHGRYTVARGISYYDWNGPEIGPEWLNHYPVTYLNKGLPRLNMRGTAKPEFFFVDTDISKIYTDNIRVNADFNALAGGRLRSLIVHLKVGKEYIVAMDDAATTAPKRIRTRVNYYNNGETHLIPENDATQQASATMTEGNSALNSNVTYMDSSNGMSKLLTQWTVIGGGSDGRVYDVNIRQSTNPLTRYDVGADCSVSNPCRIRWEDGTVNTWVESPGSFDIQSNQSGGNRYVWVRLDKSDGAVHVGYPAGVAVMCTGSVVCEGNQTDWPASGQYVRLFRPAMENGWPTTSYIENCPYRFIGPTQSGLISANGLSGVESGNCTTDGAAAETNSYGTTRVLYVDAGTATEAQMIMIHRPTSNLGETPDGEIVVLPSSGTGANHVVLQIGGADPAVLALPKAGSTASSLSFQTTHAGTARLVAAGMAPGQYEIRQDGSVAGTAQVAYGENALYAQGVGAGLIEIARTGGLALRVATGSVSPGVIGAAFQATLTAEGGTPPYNWLHWLGTVPPGLTLGIDGTLAGTPTAPGTYDLTVRVTDSSDPFEFADMQYQLTVEDSPTESVEVREVMVTDKWAEVEYGFAGLARETSCQLKLSYDAAFSGVVDSYVDQGGPSIRRAGLGNATPLALGRKHYVRVDCGVRSGFGWFNTLPTLPPGQATTGALSVPPPSLGAASLVVDYGPTPSLGSSSTGTCSGTCGVTLSLPGLSSFYWQRTYRDSSGSPVAVSSRSAAVVR